MLAPINTEQAMEGVLAIAAIKKNLYGFIDVSAAIYVKKSLGVPGIRNKINIIKVSFFSSLFNNALFV